MMLLKRMALAVMLSGFSETAIAQQTSPPAQPAPPPRGSEYGEADGVHILESIDTRAGEGRPRELLFVSARYASRARCK